MTLGPDDPLEALEGVGSSTARRMRDAFGIHSVRELLEHWPRRHQDAGEILDLDAVTEGEPATLIGEVVDVAQRRVTPRGRRRTMDLVEITVRQAGGHRFGVTFFNQRWRARQLDEKTVAAFSGQVKRFRGQLQLSQPEVQVLGRVAAGVDASDVAERLRHQRLLAVYPAVDGVSSLRIAGFVEDALEQVTGLDDWLEPTLREAHDLVDLETAVRMIHRPADHDEIARARRRLVFDELFCLQLGVQWRRARLEADAVGVRNTPRDDRWAGRLLDTLPFEPTAAQSRALSQIGGDLDSPRPMHRLLQGDVGAGKTLVALWTMLCAVDAGRQAVLMAPTEILAEQHFRTLSDLLGPLGLNVLDGIRADVLTASVPTSARRRILGELLSGDIDLVVGTHALLEEGVRFRDLGVAVVDEQHRFGVAQRVRLRQKADAGGQSPDTLPDVLVMTATPIPRSLAMTVYGDLDVTVLDELPPGRQPVTTQLITPDEAGRRDALYAFVRREAADGHRAYVVCPFVTASDAVAGTAAVDEHQRLTAEVFPDLDVDLVHGRMSGADKDAAMARFRAGDAQILVSTTVIEVGVDVPEATVMIIEDAERFGVSQLHQLRGRVGRGGARSYCVLFAGWKGEMSDDAAARLEAVTATTDGFALAEADLDLRGAGQLFGNRQSGRPDLRLTQLRRDTDLIALTRSLAREVLDRDGDLAAAEHRALRDEVLRRYEGGVEAFEALETG